MSEYRYTERDRISQLRELAVALENLIGYLIHNNLFPNKVSEYEYALEQTNILLNHGFDQSQLSVLSRAVPDLFFRHKEWIPPFEDGSNDYSKPAQWFIDLEKYLQPVLKHSGIISIIGYY